MRKKISVEQRCKRPALYWSIHRKHTAHLQIYNSKLKGDNGITLVQEFRDGVSFSHKSSNKSIWETSPKHSSPPSIGIAYLGKVACMQTGDPNMAWFFTHWTALPSNRLPSCFIMYPVPTSQDQRLHSFSECRFQNSLLLGFSQENASQQ